MFVISKQTLELNKFLHLYVQMRPFTVHVQKINLICLQNEFIERRISKRSKKIQIKKNENGSRERVFFIEASSLSTGRTKSPSRSPAMCESRRGVQVALPERSACGAMRGIYTAREVRATHFSVGVNSDLISRCGFPTRARPAARAPLSLPRDPFN